MCVVVDEPWEVYRDWWGIGKCSDCGRTGRVLYEECGPSDWHDSNKAYEFAEALMLNDGVPDLRSHEDEIARDTVYDLIWFAKPEIEDTIKTCLRCLEARRWLSEWCRSWIYGDYCSDIINHWIEDEVGHHMSMGRLVAYAERGWRLHRTGDELVPVDIVRQLVDQSLAWLRTKTGKQYAAA